MRLRLLTKIAVDLVFRGQNVIWQYEQKAGRYMYAMTNQNEK